MGRRGVIQFYKRGECVAPSDDHDDEGCHEERESDPAEGQLAAAMQRIGELSMEIELLRAKMERPGPLDRRRSR